MSRLNSIQLFQDAKQIVVAQNESLPQLDGSQLTGLVSKVNNKIGNIQIVAGSGFVTVDNGIGNNQISIDIDVPITKSLLIQLNGSNVSTNDYSVSYNSQTYLVTIVHNLNHRVIGFLFDENDKQAFYGIDYVDDNTVSIQFQADTMPNAQNVWKLSLGIGGGIPINISTVQPSNASTDAQVPSSKAVYTFVSNQIYNLSSNFSNFQTSVNSSFSTIDSNFQEVTSMFSTVRSEFAQADNLLDQKISRVLGIVQQMYDGLEDISSILDEINGLQSSEQSSQESSLQQQLSQSE